MFETIVLAAFAVTAVLFAISLYWIGRIRRREALFRWASSQGYKLLSYKQPALSELSPFPVSASKAQQIFRIEVEDRQGSHRSGWVRLGSAWRGLASDAADERWETA